jgi:hypothetical protein
MNPWILTRGTRYRTKCVVIILALKKKPERKCKECMFLSLSPMTVRSMQDLGLLQDQFPGASIPSYFYPASSIRCLQIIFNHHFLDFSADLPSGIFLNTFFAFLSFRSLWLVQIIHAIFSFTEPNISLSIYLSNTPKIFQSLLLSVQTCESYITTDLWITVR